MFLNVLKLKDVLPVDYYVKMVLVPIHLKTVLKSIALLIYHINNDGFCVTETKFCNTDNGCPFDKVNKCPNGKCVSDLSTCVEATCPSD